MHRGISAVHRSWFHSLLDGHNYAGDEVGGGNVPAHIGGHQAQDTQMARGLNAPLPDLPAKFVKSGVALGVIPIAQAGKAPAGRVDCGLRRRVLRLQGHAADEIARGVREFALQIFCALG